MVDPTAEWLAIQLDNDWVLVDVEAALQCLEGRHLLEPTQKDLNKQEAQEMLALAADHLFLVEPQDFLLTHLPDQPDWQLVETPVSSEQFDVIAYRKSFYDVKLLA